MEPYTPPSLKIVNSVTVKLTDKNYVLWKRQFEAFLNGQGLLGFVTGSTPQPVAAIPVQTSTVQLLMYQTQTLLYGFRLTKLYSHGCSGHLLKIFKVSYSTALLRKRSGPLWPVTSTEPHHLDFLSFNANFRPYPSKKKP